MRKHEGVFLGGAGGGELEVVGVVNLGVGAERQFEGDLAPLGHPLVAGVQIARADLDAGWSGRRGGPRRGLLGAVDDGLAGVGREKGGRGGEQGEQERIFHDW